MRPSQDPALLCRTREVPETGPRGSFDSLETLTILFSCLFPPKGCLKEDSRFGSSDFILRLRWRPSQNSNPLIPLSSIMSADLVQHLRMTLRIIPSDHFSLLIPRIGPSAAFLLTVCHTFSTMELQ